MFENWIKNGKLSEELGYEKAKDFLEEKIKVNNAVRQEAIKSGDTNAIELTDALDTETSAIETVLNKLETTEQKYILEKVAKEEVEELLENSVSKDIVKKYLEEEQERYNVYKREVEQNNNLKSGLWRHMGAKNMCEKILGIESLVTLD